MKAQTIIIRLIIYSPYNEPVFHRRNRCWRWTVTREPGEIRDILALSTTREVGG